MFDLKLAPRSVVQAAEDGGLLRVFATDGETPELMVMDDIGQNIFGEGISAVSVRSFLDKHKGIEVKARFNSFGGDAYEGIVMHNAFQEHGNVTAVVDGIAFSAAAIAISGANRILMQEASDFGIHHAWTVAAGNAEGLRGAIEWLDSVDEKQVSIFSARTGKDPEQIREWMAGTDDGTLFNAQAALDAGFADEIIPMRRNQTQEKAAARAHHRIAAELRQKRLKQKIA